jgi:hypothetical protein
MDSHPETKLRGTLDMERVLFHNSHNKKAESWALNLNISCKKALERSPGACCSGYRIKFLKHILLYRLLQSATES